MTTGGGRFDFDDGGSYIGGWQDGKAHGLGLCTGPKGQGEFAGEWTDGFESCGVYIWPSGNTYEGMWTKGKRHGEGVETKGRWIYKGEWTTGFKGRYGVREALTSAAKYEGSWVTGMQDGYGVETYADGGTYSGQWLRGTRNGYGVRTSAPFEAASCYRDERYLRESLTSIRSIDESENIVKDREKKQEEARGGFVLKAVGDESPTARRKSIFEKKSSLKKTFLGKLKKQRSTGDICESPRGGRSGGSIRSAYSNVSDASAYTDNLHVPTNVALGRNPVNNIPSGCIETYRGEWKNDKRSGFGLCERTDGLRYEGEWFNNKKNGYGVTTFPDGGTEEGKYKNDTLITASGKKPKLFVLRTSKIRERVEAAVQQARQANQMGVQKAEMAANRQQLAREKADMAERRAEEARALALEGRLMAKEYAPEFVQPGEDFMRKREEEFPSIFTNGGASVSPSKGGHGHGGASGPWPPKNSLNVEPQMRSHSPAFKDSLKPDTTSETLEVSGGSRRGSFRSSFRRSPSKNQNEASGGLSSGHGGNDDRLLPMVAAATQSARTNSNTLPGGGGGGGGGGGVGGGGGGGGGGGIRHHTPLRRGQPQQQQRLGDMLNSTLLNDHFDQYSTLDHRRGGALGTRDSGLGRESSLEESMPSTNSGLPRGNDSEFGDSGASEISSLHSRGSRSRRRTLPSLMTTVPVPAPTISPPPSATCRTPINTPPDHVRSEEDLHGTFIIENGIRKRVQAEAAAGAGLLDEEDFPTQERLAPLPRSYRIESQAQLRKDLGEGSLPDVSQCRVMQKEGLMTREEVSKLSQARRQELLKDLERRKQGEIVIRFADVKDWCFSHVVILIVFAINSLLGFLFLRLLMSNESSTKGSS